MTSIDDTDHGEQEDDGDEWETVWVPGDYLQHEASRQQQRFSDPHTRALEDLNRMQDLSDSPLLRALRRMDQIAVGMPAVLEDQRHVEEQMMRAQGLLPQCRRKQRARAPIVRQPTERPSTPPRREDAPPVAS